MAMGKERTSVLYSASEVFVHLVFEDNLNNSFCHINSNSFVLSVLALLN